MTDTTVQPDTTTLHVHQRATETIDAMHRQMFACQSLYGGDHMLDRVITPYHSLVRGLSQLFSSFFGHTSTIAADGSLSLFVSHETGFVYGMVFHRGDPYALVPKPEHADLPDASHGAAVTCVYCYVCKMPVDSRYPEAHPAGEDHTPCIAPMWGTWSFHS